MLVFTMLKTLIFKEKNKSGVPYPRCKVFFVICEGGTTNCVHVNRGILTVGLI